MNALLLPCRPSGHKLCVLSTCFTNWAIFLLILLPSILFLLLLLLIPHQHQCTHTHSINLHLQQQSRSRLMHRLADLMDRHLTQLSLLESLDMGKPLWQSFTKEIPLCIDNVRYFAGCVCVCVFLQHTKGLLEHTKA